MNKTIKNFLPTAQAIQKLLYPYAEVLIHDIKKNKIAAIFHPFSKRRVNEPSLLSQQEILSLEDCMGPYEKTNWDGRKIKSVSSLIRDENSKTVGILCINLDISKLAKINDFIATFLNQHTAPQPSALFKEDWQEKINNYVHAYINGHHLNLESLNRKEKKKLISHLHKIGAFTAKNAALYIAQVLKVSRATIYNYLSTTD